MLNHPTVQQISTTSWQEALRDMVTEVEELFALLDLDPAFLPKAKEASHLFSFKVPRRFIAKMQKGNVHDPLLKQILPLAAEFEVLPTYSKDPLAEMQFNPIPGLLHKYHGRVLLTVTSGCGINCRYCFRRHFAYADNNVGRQGREKIIQYIKSDSSIAEIILSGGDPLLADDDYLQELTEQLFAIPHLKRLRVHSRLPIVLPERITPSILKWLARHERQNVLVLHCNHAQELDNEVKEAVMFLRKSGVTILNQTVLLRGINDDVVTQVNLNEALFANGILPYYLHTLDKVVGAAHFDISNEAARSIYRGMQEKLPGFLVPKWAREMPGAKHKVLQF